eukprot:symbB.v1.2.028104.t1/scaffold2943.1/size66754/10
MVYRGSRSRRAFVVGCAIFATLAACWYGLVFLGCSRRVCSRPTVTIVLSTLEWGELGEQAKILAQSLETEDERKEWLQLLEVGKEDWEEVKLALGLLWQKAAEEGRDGGPLGYPMAFARLVEGVYDGPDGTEILVADIEARLTQVPSGDPSGDPALWRRSVAASCFKELGFVTRGV